MTQLEFEQQYASGSGVTVEWLRLNDYTAVPCDCDYEGCRGWQMLHGESICTGCGKLVKRRDAERIGSLDWHPECFPSKVDG